MTAAKEKRVQKGIGIGTVRRPFGGPGDFAQGRFRPKAPKWKLQFYVAFCHKSCFWALPGDAEMKLFEAKSAAEISLEKVSFPKRLKTDQGGQGDQKVTHDHHRGDLGWRPGPQGGPFRHDLSTRRTEGNKETAQDLNTPLGLKARRIFGGSLLLLGCV